MKQYIKHYYISETTKEFLVSEIKFPFTQPYISGLDVKYYGKDDNGIPYCLSEVPDHVEVQEVNPGLWVLTKEEWDNEAYKICSALEDDVWYGVREKRNKLLSESDWTQSRDVILDNDSDWVLYRQSLRNIPQDYTNTDDVIWPVKPQ